MQKGNSKKAPNQFFLVENLRFLRTQANYGRGKLNQGELAEDLGIKRGTYNKWEIGENTPSLEYLSKLSHYYGISMDELVHTPIEQKGERIRDGKQWILPIQKDLNERDLIEMVDQTCLAGYPLEYNNSKFIADLPHMYFPTSIFGQGKFRAFEIEGDSMPPFEPGDFAIGLYLGDPGNLKIKEGKRYIVNCNEGLFLKRIHEHTKKKNTLQLFSDNTTYDPFEIARRDVWELWEMKYSIHRNEEIQSRSETKQILDLLRKIEGKI